MEVNKVYNENCLTTMSRMPDCFVNLVLTSPPYYLNKEYEKTISYDDYCHMMEKCFVEWNRILVGGGYAVVNFGDYYNSGNRFYKADVPACYPATINYFKWGVETAKMDLQATRIWRKQFARMTVPFVCNEHPRPVFDYEHVWAFRKRNGSNAEFVNDHTKTRRGVIGDDWNSPAGLNDHCAAFPIELPKWAIEVYSKPDSLVYDPFMGSGTTAAASIRLRRKWLGSELSEEYCRLAQGRIDDEQKGMLMLEEPTPKESNEPSGAGW
jgi:site-specific DNA-methyltransferase (adenine-specific)